METYIESLLIVKKSYAFKQNGASPKVYFVSKVDGEVYGSIRECVGSGFRMVRRLVVRHLPGLRDIRESDLAGYAV